MARVHTEAQKAATKWKRADNPAAAATKKASQKWRNANPDKANCKKGHHNTMTMMALWK